MSAMGCIGHIMGGSGLDELFKTVYVAGSLPKIMSGNAFARAFRAHLLASGVCLFTFLDDTPSQLGNNDRAAWSY